MTRVYFTIALRESFALPFIYMQVGLTALYVKQTHKDLVRVFRSVVVASLCADQSIVIEVALGWHLPYYVGVRHGMAICSVCVAPSGTCTVCSATGWNCPQTEGGHLQILGTVLLVSCSCL